MKNKDGMIRVKNEKISVANPAGNGRFARIKAGKDIEIFVDDKKIKEENREPAPLDSVTLAIEKETFTILPYVSKLSDKLGKILKRHNLSVSFKTEQKVEHFFNSGKDKTDPILGSGVYRVPCSCGRFYIGRTNQQLGERLQEHKISIDKSLRLENKNDNFDSALAQHIYENPDHLVLFEEATLISTVNGLPQSFKRAIEIKKNNI